MEQEELLRRLLRMVEDMAITVKYDRGNFKGGLVRYHKNDFLYLNRKDDTEAKINTIVNELANRNIPPELMTSEIRKLLDSRRN